MGKGYLKVELRTGEDFLPVAGQKIYIYGEDNRLMFELISDSAGNTEYVELDCPDKEISYDPDAKERPYGVYDVEIPFEKGYKRVLVHGVQIFDGEKAIEQIKMVPAVDGLGDEQNTDEIYIPDGSPLYDNYDDGMRHKGKTRLERGSSRVAGVRPYGGLYRGGGSRGGLFRQNEPLAAGTSPNDPISADEIIIPDYIVVHLGTPNATVNDVRVPFIDYIKNVASSEIFPTWPEEALKANIYAQITFALNRIFTVWYRSRGFAFDITNSTAFDQAFVYGRNIFESVGNIVDGIFNQFVRRMGRLEPMFTQYCNGTTVTCSGLSQWGTVTLAESGYSAFQMLQYYYPSDVRIFESNNFISWSGTYGGTPLRQGSTGSDVQLMQNFLNRIRTNYPLIPLISSPNGTFGAETTAAVKVFQDVFDLFADGIIGKNTWYVITRIFTSVTRLAELDSEGVRIGIGAAPPSSVLNVGSRGEDVVELQFLLNYISEFYPVIPLVIQSGSFTDDTKRGVVEFQSLFSLTADGVVGPATWNTLYTVFKAIDGTITPGGPSGPAFPGYALRAGSTGENVRIMQSYLSEIGRYYPSIPAITADGVFGSRTTAAVRAFQQLFGLNVDGIIGNITWNKIVDVYNGLTGYVSPEFPGYSLRVGSTGENVRVMQEFLRAISAVYTSIPQITADGIFGARTQAAVTAFQRQFGLSADGIIGPVTWAEIVRVYNSIR